MRLSIIIVSYNVKYFLEYCLCSLNKACAAIETEIIVIDNNSSDGSKLFFKENFPKVKFIWNDENIGFAKANNLALQQCTGEYILFLNPDTILPEDCLTSSLSFFESQQKAGALGIRMIDGSGKFLKESKRAFPSPFTALYKIIGLSNLFPHSKTFAHYHLGNLDEHKNHEVDVLAGAFMLIPKKVLDEVGSFDEDFFMYGEDIDLSYRIQKAGYKNYYFAGSTIIHFKGESTKKGSLNYVRLFHNAMSLFVKKHYNNKRAWLFRILMHLVIWGRAFITTINSALKRMRSFFTKSLNAIKQNNTLIVANENEYNALIEKCNGKKNIIGRVSNNDSAINSLGTISVLPALIKKYAVQEIIFCADELSFKKIIETIQRLPGTVRYEFYTSCANSIISSSSKDDSGDYFLLK